MGLDYYTRKLESETNDNNIKISVLDTGIRSIHEVFSTTVSKDRIDYNGAYDYVNDDNDPTDDNDHSNYTENGVNYVVKAYGHGTMVSGIIAQSTSKNVKIVPVKVLDASGSGSLSNVIAAINDVKDKVDIINMSLGVPYISTDNRVKSIEEVLKSVYDNTNIVIVCAAGNESSNVSYPANSKYTLAISSINQNSSFSSSFSNYGREVDFAAPGEDLTLPCLYANSCYVSGESGTSFSSPYVASAFSMIRAENPNLSRNEMINILKNNSADLGVKGKDNYYGNGSVNFFISKFPLKELSDGTKVSYNKDGSYYKGFKKIEDKLYFFSYANGKTKTGWQTIDGKKYFYCNEDGTVIE